MDNRKNLWIIFILISLCHRSESTKAVKVTFTGQDQDQPVFGHAVNNGGCDCDVLETRDPQFPSGHSVLNWSYGGSFVCTAVHALKSTYNQSFE